MTNEKQLAENICRCHAQTIVDHAGGITLGGYGLAEGFAKMWHNMNTYECEQALRHWVIAAGYRSDGTFGCVFADSIQNC